MFRSFITIAAVAGLVAGASAQQQMPAGSLQPVSTVQYGSYDFNNGFTVTNGGNRASGPDTLFDTTGNVAYYYGVIGAGTSNKQEWLDSTALPDRGAVTNVEEINGMSWLYCEGGYAAYFDAVISIYDNTSDCVGPTHWIPNVASFGDCLYGILGLPGSGCWQVTVDLDCGLECVMPDISGGFPIGWSVTPYINSPFIGPFLGKQGQAAAGSSDLFEWRDWTGEYFTLPYTYAGCYWFGGIGPARADFHVAFYGSPLDVEGVYGSGSLDTLCLQAMVNPEPGGTLSLVVEDADPVARTYVRIINAGSPANASMSNGFGTWTRQVSLSPDLVTVFGATGPTFPSVLAIPGSVPNDLRAQVQIVEMTGPVNPGNVSQATNGLDFRL